MLWTLFHIKFLYADAGDDAVGAAEIDAGNDACGKQVIDTPVGLSEVGNLQMVGLPIGSDTRIALLTADGHHLETLVILMLQVIVIQQWQVALTVRTRRIKEHDDRLARQPGGREGTHLFSIVDSERKRRHAVAHLDKLRLFLLVIVQAAADCRQEQQCRQE